MNALVVYESMWGNTKQVAEAIADGLGGARVAPVDAVDVTDVDGLDLLVVGGPTHAFSMSRASTRHDAHRQGASVGGEEEGIREWLDALPARIEVPVATFDTRVLAVRNLPGSAAKAAAKELTRRHHGRVVARNSFYVRDSSGPLADGELERARTWGSELTARVARASELT